MGRIYRVYTVAYRAPGYGFAAVAVSASSPRAAKKRLTGNRPAEVLRVEVIEGRQAEWAQDRIEGTVDLLDPMKKPPQAGDKRADLVRASNKDIIVRRYANDRN